MYMRTWVLLIVAVLTTGTGATCNAPGAALNKGYVFGVLNATAGNNATGFYYFTLDQGNGVFTFRIGASNLSSAATGFTLHCDMANTGPGSCTPGKDCPVCLDLEDMGTLVMPDVLAGGGTLKAPLVHQLATGNAYFQVSTGNSLVNVSELRGYGQNPCPVFENNTNYTGASVNVSTTETPEECCAECQMNPLCLFWTWNKASASYLPKQCSHKATRGTRVVSTTGWSGESNDDVFQRNADLPHFTAELTAAGSPYKAYAILHMSGTTSYTMQLVHTAPAYTLPKLYAGTQNPGMAASPLDLLGDVAGTGLVHTITKPLAADDMAVLSNMTLFLEIQLQGGVSLKGHLLPTDITPITTMPAAGEFDVKLWPEAGRGFEQGAVTVAVTFATANVGNEIWVTLPGGFSPSATASADHVQGAPAPTSVVVTNGQVQLRWNSSSIPFYNHTSIAFSIMDVALPNNCDAKPYTVQTATCIVEDFMGGGVLFYRKCAPASTDVSMTATPAAGVPMGCRSNGCDSCKFMYTVPSTGEMVYSCEHSGQTYYRTDISQCDACTFAETWEA